MRKIFKRVSAAVMALAVVLDVPKIIALAAVVDSGTCGTNLTWTLDDNGTLTISGNGKMKDYGLYGGAQSPWLGSSEITSIVIENGVTSIGDRAF